MRKILLATTAFALIVAIVSAVDVHAQAANISRTDTSTSGVPSSVMQNAAGVTYFDNDGATLLELRNNTASNMTAVAVTQKATMTKDGYGTVALSNVSITVPSGTTVIAGPFPTARWNTQVGTVAISMTNPTGVSATALRVPK